MLWTIAVILLVLWALGLVTSTTMGGFIHLLLVIAIIVCWVIRAWFRRRQAKSAHIGSRHRPAVFLQG